MSEERNQLRLSIDIKAIKDHEFTAQLYFAYKPHPDLGIKNFRSAPTQSIMNPRVQTQINNCFRSYMFEANRAELKTKFNASLPIELWHNDRIKKDVLLGITTLELGPVLQRPFRKTKQSYAVQYDVLLPIDEVDEEFKPVKKIGALRVVVYLQDLGPLSMLKQKGFEIKNFIDDDVPYYENSEAEERQQMPALASEKYGNLSENKRVQLNELEQKVVWELEIWKKNEEASTRNILKQKQIQFWINLSEQQKKSDIEKQKQFKKIQANLALQQNKLKAKMNDLIKREQKIIVFEQELQSKISEVSREVFLKDEEIERIKRRQKEEKTAMIKEKSNLELEISKFRAENAKLRVELEQARKEDEKGPINILKNELTHKISEIKELRKELENCMEIKEEFKSYYEKMKTEVIKSRAETAQKNEQLRTCEHQKQLLRNNIKYLEQQITFLRQQQYYNQNGNSNDNEEQEDEPRYSSEKQKLINKRRQLIDGGYPVSDPLIKHLDKKIAQLS